MLPSLLHAAAGVIGLNTGVHGWIVHCVLSHPLCHGAAASGPVLSVVRLSRRAAAYIPSIVLERPIYLRETADGLFRPVIYLTHKILEETVLSIAMALVFSMLVYIIVDLAVREGPRD